MVENGGGKVMMEEVVEKLVIVAWRPTVGLEGSWGGRRRHGSSPA